MHYLPDHPNSPQSSSEVATIDPPAKAAPPTMGYFPAHPLPPREYAAEEAPPPVAAPRTPVQSVRLPPPG
jgi:hypothetical protein